MQIQATRLSGVFVLAPKRFGDARGYFCETWNRNVMAQNGLHFDFMQDNQSYSAERGTVRGLHFQAPPFAQDKLVRAARGRILDVAVDIRRGSPTYGQWVAQELSAENGLQLLVPKGFLHGFSTLEPDCDVIYKVTNPYSPECDRSIRFDDPALAIDWQTDASAAVLSAKDAAASGFSDFVSPFVFGAGE